MHSQAGCAALLRIGHSCPPWSTLRPTVSAKQVGEQADSTVASAATDWRGLAESLAGLSSVLKAKNRLLSSKRIGLVSLGANVGRARPDGVLYMEKIHMKTVILPFFAIALTVAMAAPSTAQTQTAPKPQTSPTAAPSQPAVFQPAAPRSQPAVTFPLDAKYAIVDAQAVASTSVVGKEASKKLNDLQSKNAANLQDMNKQLQALTSKRETGAGVMSEAARALLDKDIDKLQRDIQYASSSAQAELQDLNNELMADFTKKVEAVVQEIAKEKGLYLVLSADSGVAYVAPVINISDEVIKRLNARKN
jgi:Skp family chaperone for outer membrane proteins